MAGVDIVTVAEGDGAMTLRNLRQAFLAGAVVAGGVTPALADPYFGFYYLPDLSNCVTECDATVFSWVTGESAEQRDRDAGDPAPTVASSAQASMSTANASITSRVDTQPDGSTNLSVLGSHQWSVGSDPDHGAGVSGADNTTVVEELRGGELPPGQTFTLEAQFTVNWGDSGQAVRGTGTYEVYVNDVLKLRIEKDETGGMATVFPSGTQEYWSTGSGGGAGAVHAILVDNATVGSKVKVVGSTSVSGVTSNFLSSDSHLWKFDITAHQN